MEQAGSMVIEQMQFRTLHFLQTQSLQNPVSGYGQPVVQSTYQVNQSPFMNHFTLKNATPQAEQLSTTRTDPSVIDLLDQQQGL